MSSFRFLLFLLCAASSLAKEWRFHFENPAPVSGSQLIKSDTAYDVKSGFGFLPGRTPESAVFALDVPEGNYAVTVRLGHAQKATKTTLYAESRRLMLHEVETLSGKFSTHTFTVNVRKPAIAGGGLTALKDREKGPPPVPDWDEHLTLEFVGKQAGVASLHIHPTTEVTTVFLAGDSTVTDQPYGPYFGWGQMLPRFFTKDVSISNHAESGLALFSFEGGRRLKKIQSMMKPGDYLLIQFGHNDQKDKRKEAGPFTTYQANLKRFIAAAREKGGIPVLVTPMERRRFQQGNFTPTLNEFAEAVRKTGVEENVPVIDLNAMSLVLYNALGGEGSKKAFVHYPPNTFPGRDQAISDDTHHGAYGGYQLARCMVEGIRTQVPALAKHLAADAGSFDPKKPEPAESIHIPWNVYAGQVEKPDGN
jgi:lysophospholipase L1-like esterase